MNPPRIRPTESELSRWAEAEVWRAIPDTNGMYEISSMGRARSWMVQVIPGRTLPTYLKPSPSHPSMGYVAVGISGGDKQRKINVHRLVTRAFIGPCPRGYVVRHLNGVSTDNRISNLVYGTPSENARDRRLHGTDRELRKTHCPQGHPYDDVNTRIENGKRKCRECVRKRNAARKKAKAAERRLLNPRPATPAHGTYGVYRKCSLRPGGACPECRAAKAAYMRDFRKRRRTELGGVPPGYHLPGAWVPGTLPGGAEPEFHGLGDRR